MVKVEPVSGFEVSPAAPRGGKGLGGRSRAGRPALAGDRYPSGQLKPADKREGVQAPALLKRNFDEALRGAADPLYGTSLGLLFMHGKISAAQLTAGTAFARLRGRYDRAMGMPCRFTASPDYGTARAISDRGPMTDAEVEAIKDRHARTLGYVGAAATGSVAVSAGDGSLKRLDGEAARPVRAYDARRVTALLERVCVDDLACEGYELDRLRTALDLLVPWFGTEARKGR